MQDGVGGGGPRAEAEDWAWKEEGFTMRWGRGQSRHREQQEAQWEKQGNLEAWPGGFTLARRAGRVVPILSICHGPLQFPPPVGLSLPTPSQRLESERVTWL